MTTPTSNWSSMNLLDILLDTSFAFYLWVVIESPWKEGKG